ncbi:MAG: dTDP-4-dehydrorhamnose 3,5-epimerase family protein [Burkholderiales bacterium]|jgi:dTDP-4-dehydrorhamnose 3,5-epimerase
MKPDLIGRDDLVAKQSAVDASGELRQLSIDGVVFRPVRPVPHDDGHLVEVARADWAALSAPVVQVHLTTTLPGHVRAWGLHQHCTDRLFVVSGLIRFVVFDGRVGSPTFGHVNTLLSSALSPGLLFVPPNLYHGWKNIGNNESSVINMPTRLYDYEKPDALDLPWDSAEAAALIPYQW